MGVVYLARDPVIDRQLAIKTIRILGLLDVGEDSEFIKRFYQEARAAGGLSHPAIVTIHDAGFDTDSQMHFIAMEFIPGRNLKEVIMEGTRLEMRDVAAIIARLASALAYAHQRGIVHRDIKPANIIINEKGEVKITDFGIAKVPASQLTTEGQYLGTPSYMSPEQVLGTTVDGRSDIFSLGIVFYELLTLKKPFPGSNLTQVSHRIAFDPYIPIRDTRHDCPEEFQRVMERALAKEPEKRYSSAAEMAEDLTRFLERGPQKSAIDVADVTMIMRDQPAAKAVPMESQGTVIYSGQAPGGPAKIELPSKPVPAAPTEMPSGPTMEYPKASKSGPVPPSKEKSAATPSPPVPPKPASPPSPPPAPARPPSPPSAAPKGAPPPAEPPKPAAKDKKKSTPAAPSPPATGARKKFIAWIAAHKKLEILSYTIYFRWVLAIVGAWAILWAVILGVLYLKARAQTPIQNASTYGDRAIEWRKDMQKGTRVLRAGNGAEASALFQSVLVQIPDSPALRLLEKEALRRQDLEISTQSSSKRLAYYLRAGEDAFNRRDMGTAREYFQQALQVDAGNAAAKAYLQKIQSRSPAPLEGKAARVPAAAVEPAAAPVAAAAPEPPPAAVSSVEPSVLVRFVSPVPQGYITINADENQILRKEFNFFKKKGLFGKKEFIAEPLEATFSLHPGGHELKFWVTAKAEGFTAHGTVKRSFARGKTYTLNLQLNMKSKSLTIAIQEQ